MMSSLFSLLPCHRMKSRSYVFRGKQFPICARCTSILLGYLATPLLFLIVTEATLALLLWGVVFNLPMLIDGFTQAKKLRTSNNTLRTITGVASGIGQSFLIVVTVRFLVEYLLTIH